ncbi:MAG: hypothetical protein AB1458_09925 [Bacteroidota bacterium]
MKKYLYCLLLSGSLLPLASCGGSSAPKEEEKPDNPLEALQKVGEEMKGGTDEAQQKMEERRKKGDTLVMKYEELMKFLPSEVSGYKRGEPDGASVNAMGSSFSNAEVRFEKENGDYVKVVIVDYNQAYSLYSSAAMAWTMGFSVDSPEEKANSVKLDNNIAGWEVYKKKSKDANITLGAGYRFWINVEANNQADTEFVKSVAKSIDLGKLASM